MEAVFQDDDGELSETTRVPLFAWAVVQEIDKKTAHTQATGLHIDDEGQICEACWSEGFLRYERIDITERPRSSGKWPGPMEEEPEDMSIRMVRSVSSVFSAFQWDRRVEYRRRSWWGRTS